MTIETKITIQPSDIITVEFECAKCHSITTWPLAVAKKPPIRCHCSDEQWMTPDGDTYRAVVDLIAQMHRFSSTKNEPFIMRFGVKYSAALSRGATEKD